jgi:hypothetical protein
MKKTIDFDQTVINDIMSLAWELKIYEFGPTLRKIVTKGLEYKKEILEEALETRA